jgi:NAD(P)H-hydrate epimerase
LGRSLSRDAGEGFLQSMNLSSPFLRHAILTATEMRRAETLACAGGMPSFTLMQRAGEMAAAIIRDKFPPPRRVLVLCGPGNNGGDGFIVATRLRDAGFDVTVAAMSPATVMCGDAEQAASAWDGPTGPLENASFDQCDLVIDALFGTGLTRPLAGAALAAVESLSHYPNIPVIALDIPSGVNADTGAIMGAAPPATLTITFACKKIGHLLWPGAGRCGEVIVADIGIPPECLAETMPRAAENHPDLWRDLLPVWRPDQHKYDHGHLLIRGGGMMTGASRLAARAAQRIGAGLVSLSVPSTAFPIYAEALESVIVKPSDNIADWQAAVAQPKVHALLIGPGLGTEAAQKEWILAALATGKPCVLDADIFTCFADQPAALLDRLHPACVLTPHQGEFSRLFGPMTGDKLTQARQAAARAGYTVLLKGPDTIIAAPDGQAVINANAPPWLATGGAGDVLAGMIAGLLAQRLTPFWAASASVWLHGRAAQLKGKGLIAEDLVDAIPAALRFS